MSKAEPSTYQELQDSMRGWPLDRPARTLAEIQGGAPAPGSDSLNSGLRWQSRDEPPRPPEPEQHGETDAGVPSAEDLRERRLQALEADVAAQRVSLARLETLVTNLQGDSNARI